jgi:hypothetical protein
MKACIRSGFVLAAVFGAEPDSCYLILAMSLRTPTAFCVSHQYPTSLRRFMEQSLGQIVGKIINSQ